MQTSRGLGDRRGCSGQQPRQPANYPTYALILINHFHSPGTCPPEKVLLPDAHTPCIAFHEANAYLASHKAASPICLSVQR